MDSDRLTDFAEKLTSFLEKGDKITEFGLKLGLAYTGFKATNHWSGGLTALIALKLAESPNMFAGASGVGMLALLGLTAFVPPWKGSTPPEIPTMEDITSAQIGGFGSPAPINYPVEEGNVVSDLWPWECTQQGGTILRINQQTGKCDCRMPEAPPTVFHYGERWYW